MKVPMVEDCASVSNMPSSSKVATIGISTHSFFFIRKAINSFIEDIFELEFSLPLIFTPIKLNLGKMIPNRGKKVQLEKDFFLKHNVLLIRIVD
jgi:hypothetical protein